MILYFKKDTWIAFNIDNNFSFIFEKLNNKTQN